MSTVHHVSHPLIEHHLTRLRDRETPSDEFRRLIGRLAVLLTYEATQDLHLASCQIHTPLVQASGQLLNQRIGLVPIMRAGLAMVDPILNLIPTAEVWHLGVYRDEDTMRPVEYYSRFPSTHPLDVALVLDPMLATGGSATAALHTLEQWGVPRVKLLSVIAARAGLDAVTGDYPQVPIFTCAIDPILNDQKFIEPGLGDAGDRAFNTPGQDGS